MEQLPEFEYLERLGGGHFGVVYRCGSRLTHEVRAVKHIALKGSADIAAWRAEAEALAACKNDHIVRIHHAAATGDGPVLVMDYLSGGDAERRWLPAGGPVGDVIDCLIDATWGLHHMHTAGLVHRDLKPANLLFDAAGRAVIGDFGLAGQATKRADFAYAPHIPPEVLGGADWTPVADIYALGVTAWRLLGAPPKPDGPDLASALQEGIWPDREWWPLHVHARARRVLRAAMQPDPGRRPASAARLREALTSARPVVSLREVGPGSWAGTGNRGTHEVTCEKVTDGWVVRATRDAGKGTRRLRPDVRCANTADATQCIRNTLEALATSGGAGLR